MSIILSKIPLDPSEPGYQTQSSIEEVFNSAAATPSAKASKNRLSKCSVSEEVYVKRKSKQIKIQ
jgi:hypothetical protein